MEKCYHIACDQPATVSIDNAGAYIYVSTLWYCTKHAAEFMKKAMFPENYLRTDKN